MQTHYHHQILVEGMLEEGVEKLQEKTLMFLEVKADAARRPSNLVYLRWLWQVELEQTIPLVVYPLWMALYYHAFDSL